MLPGCFVRTAVHFVFRPLRILLELPKVVLESDEGILQNAELIEPQDKVLKIEECLENRGLEHARLLLSIHQCVEEVL